MIEILRLWDRSDFDLKSDEIAYLFQRPRIDFRVSEYIYELINKELLISKNIMQKGDYTICLSFDILDLNKQKFFYDSVYNSDTTKFWPMVASRKEKGRTYKAISIGCSSFLFNNEMTPRQYAEIVFDMYGSFLVDNYKKLSKDILDQIKKRIDYSFIDSFPFPASFENQKYILDKGSKQKTYSDGIIHEKGEIIVIKDVYMKYFGF